MANENKASSVYVNFSNYNYSFNYFYETYKKICMEISEEDDIRKVQTIIYTFISEFSYAIPKIDKKTYYIKKIVEIKAGVDRDKDIARLMLKENKTTQEQIEYLRLFYIHFRKDLKLLGEYTEDLTATLMPNLNIQRKLIRFSNNQIFFDKLTEYKRVLMSELSDFRIQSFRKPVNLFITYYFAYKLFVNESRRMYIEKSIDILFDKLLHNATLSVLARYPKLLQEEMDYIMNTESQFHSLIMKCNVKMNQSLSDYNILPKINNKVDIDRHLI